MPAQTGADADLLHWPCCHLWGLTRQADELCAVPSPNHCPAVPQSRAACWQSMVTLQASAPHAGKGSKAREVDGQDSWVPQLNSSQPCTGP